MASHIAEFFGFPPADDSNAARLARRKFLCPFLEATCTKTLSDGTISGVCTLKPITSAPVICCPNRLYAGHYQLLRDVADAAFGTKLPLFNPSGNSAKPSGEHVSVFGKRWGKELRLPNRGKSGGYFVDWVLARINQIGELADFVALEVQSIDTTGNYRAERKAILDGESTPAKSTAGFNWENVNKRILPQIIYKGHVLRQEPLCTRGLFFACPGVVYAKISERLGGALRSYPMQPGSLTFFWYDLGPSRLPGEPAELVHAGQFTTTIDQVAHAFAAPTNLPPSRVYELAIRAALD